MGKKFLIFMCTWNINLYEKNKKNDKNIIYCGKHLLIQLDYQFKLLVQQANM